jgi:catechol 2,3-dioxygenase-like lactoylglutathione lyase family enzyme
MRLHQVAQRAVDLDRASAFYSRLLGAEPVAVFDPPGLVFFDLDGVRLLLDRGAPSALVYLGVDDVWQTVKRLRAEGVSVVAEPHVIFRDDQGLFGAAEHDEVMAFFEDSEGNTVGVASRHPSR